MNNIRKGMMCIILAAFFFAAMNVFVKLAGDLPSIQKSFFRNLVAALFAFFILLKSKQGFTYKQKDLPMLLFIAQSLERWEFFVIFMQLIIF